MAAIKKRKYTAGRNWSQESTNRDIYYNTDDWIAWASPYTLRRLDNTSGVSNCQLAFFDIVDIKCFETRDLKRAFK